MAGMPSSSEPRTAKTTIETARNPARPPGICAIASTRVWLKPDWVIAQAMAVAMPMMSRMAPESAAVVDQHRIEPAPVELTVDQQAEDQGVGDPDGGDLGRGRDAFDDGRADQERQHQRRQGDNDRCGTIADGRARSRWLTSSSARAEVAQRHQRQGADRSRQHAAGEQPGDRDAGRRSRW